MVGYSAIAMNANFSPGTLMSVEYLINLYVSCRELPVSSPYLFQYLVLNRGYGLDAGMG